MALATAGPSALWYLTRATGAVTLLLLTASVVLGVINVGRVHSPSWPRFVIDGVHRNVSLLALVVLVVHIATSVLDPFAGIKLLDAFVPFTGSYRPLWLGFGALASDMLIAVAITSILRRHVGHALWRAVHWLAYLCWPIAVLHTVGTGSDVKQVWLLALTALCILAAMIAVWVRVGFGWPSQLRLRGSALAASIVLPAVFIVWMPSGPLGSDWAKRAGTPAKLLASTSSSATGASSQQAVSAFGARVSGTVTQTTDASGQAQVDIALRVASATLPALHVRITGNQEGSGVAMTSSSVTIGSTSDPSRFSGQVSSLAGTAIRALVSSGTETATLAITLQISGGSASGTLQLTPAR